MGDGDGGYYPRRTVRTLYEGEECDGLRTRREPGDSFSLKSIRFITRPRMNHERLKPFI